MTPREDSALHVRSGAPRQLGEPLDVLTDLPHGPDHGASRIVFGPDGKLVREPRRSRLELLGVYCVPIRAQELPTAADIAARDWRGYEGKILRVNMDGSIPADNPVLNGVRSHVFTMVTATRRAWRSDRTDACTSPSTGRTPTTR